MQTLQIVTTKILAVHKIDRKVPFGAPFALIRLGKCNIMTPIHVMPASDGSVFGGVYTVKYMSDYEYKLSAQDLNYTVEQVEMDFLFATHVGIILSDEMREMLNLQTWQMKDTAMLSTHPRNN